jgi:hypothetical protein
MFAFSPTRVAELLARIGTTMEGSPDEFDAFKRWAEATLRRVIVATKSGDEALRWQLYALRQEQYELHQLETGAVLALAATARTSLQRVCRREWLEDIATWLEEDLDLEHTREHPVAA